MKTTMMERLVERFEDVNITTADGFDDAILGFDEASERVIYSISAMVEVLCHQGMSEEEACEYLDYNVVNAYVGEHTPIWCEDRYF